MDERFLPTTHEAKLARVIEECGEVIQMYGKCMRHGYYSVNPLLPPEEQETNMDALYRELNDLQDALKRL